jgi:hypothetical protein
VGRLYLTLIGLTLVFACSMSFATLGVYTDTWWPAAVAGGTFVIFAAVAGAAIPRALRSLTGGYRRTARAAVVMCSSWWGLLFFVMAMISWALGKRVVGPNNAYLTLGLLVFLGLAGAGIQGVVAMTAWFVHVRNQAIVVPARLEARELGAREHGSSAGHRAPLSEA